MLNMNFLFDLEPFQKFAVVVVVGGWSKGILEFPCGPNLGLRTWSLDQAEQKRLYLLQGLLVTTITRSLNLMSRNFNIYYVASFG